jgi:O-antigen/teichoic acid export membrane protein
LSALATIAVLSFGGGAKGIVAGSIASTLVVQVVAVVVIRRIAPGLSFGRPSWDGAAMRSVVSYSSAMFLLQFSTLLLTRSDELVIARVMSLEAITPYVLARRLSELPHLITDQAMGVLLPVASGLAALDEMETLQKLLLTSSRLCLAVLVSLTVPLAMLAGHALKLWLGAPYQAYAYLVVILATSMLIDSASWPAGSVLLGKARHYPVAISSAIAAVSSIVLSVVLGQRLGLAGIALGTLLPTAAVCLFFVLPFSLHVCDISIKTFTSQVVVPALAPAVPAAGLIAVCMHILAELTFIHLLLTAAGALAVYWPVYLRWSATEDELRSIIGMVPESVRYLCMPQKP